MLELPFDGTALVAWLAGFLETLLAALLDRLSEWLT